MICPRCNNYTAYEIDIVHINRGGACYDCTHTTTTKGVRMKDNRSIKVNKETHDLLKKHSDKSKLELITIMYVAVKEFVEKRKNKKWDV